MKPDASELMEDLKCIRRSELGKVFLDAWKTHQRVKEVASKVLMLFDPQGSVTLRQHEEQMADTKLAITILNASQAMTRKLKDGETMRALIEAAKTMFKRENVNIPIFF